MNRPYFQHRPHHIDQQQQQQQQRYFSPHPQHHHHPNPSHILPLSVPLNRDIYHPLHFAPPHLPPPPVPRPFSTPPGGLLYRSTQYHHPQFTPPNRGNSLRQIQHHPRFFSGDSSRVRPAGGSVQPVFNGEIYPVPVGRSSSQVVYESEDLFRGLKVEIDDYGRSQTRRSDQVMRSGNYGSCNSVMSLSCSADNFDADSDEKVFRRDKRDRLNLKGSCVKGKSGFLEEIDDGCEFQEVFNERKRKSHFQESGSYATAAKFREKPFKCFKLPVQSMGKKKSALLRLKVPDIDAIDIDGFENYSNEYHLSSIRAVDSSGSFSGDCGEEGNENDLDVCIKSNVLVAKANITSSTIGVVSDTDLSTKLVKIESPRPTSLISPTPALSKHEKSNAQIDSQECMVSDTSISTQHDMPLESEAGVHGLLTDEMNYSYDKKVVPHLKNVTQMPGKKHVMSLNEEVESSRVKENTDVCHKVCNSVNTAAVNVHGMGLSIKKPEENGTSTSLDKYQESNKDLEFVNVNNYSHIFSETSADCVQNIQNGEGSSLIQSSIAPENTSDCDVKINDQIFGNLKKTRNFFEGSPKTSDHDGCGFFGNKLPFQCDNTLQPEVISPISLAGLYSKSETNSAAVRDMDSITIFNKDYSNKKNLSEEFKSILSTEVSKSSSVLPSESSALPTIEFVDCTDSAILSNNTHSQFDRSENVFCDSNSNVCLDEHLYEPQNNLEFGNVQPGYSNKTEEVNKNENPVGTSAVCYSEDPHDLLIQPQSNIMGSSELCRNSLGQKNNAVNKCSKQDVYSKSTSRTPRKKLKKKVGNNIFSSLQKFNRESKLAHKPVSRDPVVQISPTRSPEKCERFLFPKTDTLCSLPITETEITEFSEKHPIKMPILDIQLPMITSDQNCLKLDTCLSHDPNTVTPAQGISIVLCTTQKENTNSMSTEEQHGHTNMSSGNEHDTLHVNSKHGSITEDITNINQMCSSIDGESVAFVKDDDPSDLDIISLSNNLVGASSVDTDPIPNSTCNVVLPEIHGFDLQVPVTQDKTTICEENIGKECKPVHDMDLECISLVSDNDAASHDVKLLSTTFATASDPGMGSSIHSSDEGKQIQGSGISDSTNNPVHKKNHVSGGISKGTGGNSVSGHFSSKRRLPPGNNRRHHTWHRTGNTSVDSKKTNTDILNIQNVSPVISSSQFSYIHKGNSLVRKIGPVMPVQKSYYLRSSKANTSENDVKDNSGPECIVETMKTNNFPTSKEVDAKYEKHNISSADISDSICPSEDHTLEEDMKLLINPEAATVTILEDSCKFPLLGEDQVTQNQDEIGGMNMRTTDKDGLIHGKSQPNQFVISTNPSECPNHNADENNTLALDGYYKSRKNQLIRSADNISKVTLSGYSSNPGDQVPSKSILRRSPQKKYSSRIIPRRNKLSNAFRLWTYNRPHTLVKDGFSLKCQEMFSYLFPWKRTYSRKSMHNSDSRSSSLCAISKKLLLTRKRKTIYTKSFDGFSLRKSKVLSVGGSNLKWSKSIERRSRKANECATKAIAEVERKKRQQKSSTHQSYKKLGKNYYSTKSLPLRGERIFRIGSLRYKMDASRRTLQRVEAVKQASPETETKKVYIPKRLHIGDDEYVRIGNGNQLIRDPKTRSRVMAKEKIRWSLHTVRQRVAKKHTYCQFYTRFGTCKKESRKCPYIHDPSKIAVCTKFLRGSCSTSNCKLTHRVIPERMPDCSYFLQGLCSNSACPYRHVNVNPGAPICEGFLRGYCADGDECVKKHNYNCLEFEASGVCAQGSKCRLQHRKNSVKNRKKRKRPGEKSNSERRYFGSKVCKEKAEQCVGLSQNGDVFFRNGKLVDYISLDVSSEGEASDDGGGHVREVDIDSLIMPVGIMASPTR